MKVIRVNEDEEYFKDRGFEDRFLFQAEQYIEHFHPKRVLDVGCGLGHFVFAFDYYGVEVQGIEIVEYAVKNAHEKIRGRIRQGDIRRLPFEDGAVDFTLCFDVLEHLAPADIPVALRELRRVSKANFLFSICMLGDSNYEKDATHKTKRSREWWVHEIEQAGFKVEPTPAHFYFKNQLVVGGIK